MRQCVYRQTVTTEMNTSSDPAVTNRLLLLHRKRETEPLNKASSRLSDYRIEQNSRREARGNQQTQETHYTRKYWTEDSARKQTTD
jgi:hypothetical protein